MLSCVDGAGVGARREFGEFGWIGGTDEGGDEEDAKRFQGPSR